MQPGGKIGVPALSDLLAGAPKNWGEWGPDDEVGCLNYLTPEVVVRAARSVRSGKVFTLQVLMADPDGDPVYPGRSGAQHFMVNDKSRYQTGTAPAQPGAAEYADDYLCCFLQGSTQYDALGHVWCGDSIWNGFPATDTIGGLRRAGVEPIARRGVVGRGVLLDMARHRGRDALEAGETFDHTDLESCAERQGVALEAGDILIIRTGWIGAYYADVRPDFSRIETFSEPGLVYSPDLVEWFREKRIANLVTDTIGNEVTRDPNTGAMLTLHVALMRNLGVVFTEIAWLEDLASDCAEDGRYEVLYVAAPLRVALASGAPVNPVAIK